IYTLSLHDALPILNNIQKNSRLAEILIGYLLKWQRITRMYFIDNLAFGCRERAYKFFCRFKWLHGQKTILHKFIHYLKVIFIRRALTHFKGRIDHKGTHIFVQTHAELIQ